MLRGQKVHYRLQKNLTIAIAFSVVAHICIFVTFMSYRHISHMEHGVKAAFSMPIRMHVPESSQVEQFQPVTTSKEVVKVRHDKKPVVKPQPIVQQQENIAKQETMKQETIESIPVVTNPSFRGERTPPIYPRRAIRLRQEGMVLVQALIDPHGKTKDVKIIQSSRHYLLDRSALDAVWSWKFEPSYVNGVAQLSWIQVPVDFILK